VQIAKEVGEAGNLGYIPGSNAWKKRFSSTILFDALSEFLVLWNVHGKGIDDNIYAFGGKPSWSIQNRISCLVLLRLASELIYRERG